MERIYFYQNLDFLTAHPEGFSCSLQGLLQPRA